MKPEEKKSLLRKIIAQRETTVFSIILLAVVIVSVIEPKFLNVSNLRSIAIAVSTDGLLSVGLCLVLILGGIELSVGGVAAMACVITGYLCLHGVNVWIACLISLLCGVIVGVFNGLVISKIGLPPFIVTLSTMNLSRGVAYIITEGSPLSLSGNLPDSFRYLATGRMLGTPMLFVIFCVVVIISYVFTKKSNLCRNIFFVGSNENAAKFSGINVDKVKIWVYIVVAILSSIAGILSLARFNVATPELSKGAETTAISAAVIGGTSMSGGVGSVLGTFMGIILLKIVNSALVMLNVSVYWQNFVQGAILVIAVTMDYVSQRKNSSANLFLRLLGLDRLFKKSGSKV